MAPSSDPTLEHLAHSVLQPGFEGTTAPEDLRGITSGIPGASAVALVGTVATGWETDVAAWVRRARRYAEGLESAADRYAADDAAAREAFTPVSRNQPR